MTVSALIEAILARDRIGLELNAPRRSDLDLLVDMAEGRSLLDLVALGADLEEALGVPCDIATEKSLSPHLRDRVLAEAVSL
jgi:predicted nucleotidyltransferase